MKPLFAVTLGEVPVGGDDLLIHAPGGLDRDVLIRVEDCLQSSTLMFGEQVRPSAQRAPSPVERIARTSPMAGGLTLNPLPVLFEPDSCHFGMKSDCVAVDWLIGGV